MPQPVAFNTGSSISGSIQASRISYAIETSGSNYRGGYAGKTWYSELPANNGIVFIKDTTAIGRGTPGNPAFWITNGTSSASILTTVNGLPGSPRNFTTTSSAYSWSLANGFFINDPNEPFNQIDTDSLVLYLDASKTVSYPTTASTWYDISGNNDNGGLLNGITFNNNALVFDGIDDNVNIESYISMSNPTTVCALINRSITSSGDQVFFGPSANGSDQWLSISTNVLSLRGTQAEDINNFQIYGTTFISSSRWYFVTGIINGPTSSIYLNGNLERNTTQSFNIAGWGGQARIGTRATTQFPFPGQISNVQVYNKALSQAEILQNYYQAPIVTDGLVLALDASNLASYESGSTTTYSLTGSASGSLINGTGYSSNNGGSWVFDGVDDYITTSTNIISSSSDFTVDLVIKYSTSNPIYGSVFGYGKSPDNNANFGFMLHAQSGGFYALLSDGTNRSFGAAINTLQNNTIYNILFTFKSDGNTSSYINGSLINSVSPAVGFTTIKVDPSFFVALGIDVRYTGGTSSRHFLGSIYNCKLYNRILNSSEIQQNFNAQRNRFGI